MSVRLRAGTPSEKPPRLGPGTGRAAGVTGLCPSLGQTDRRTDTRPRSGAEQQAEAERGERAPRSWPPPAVARLPSESCEGAAVRRLGLQETCEGAFREFNVYQVWRVTLLQF